MEQSNIDLTSRTLVSTSVIDAPVELVWDVWTNPNHIVHWWGPNGFTNTIHLLDLRSGGEWKLTMHGPDGVNYPNRSIFKESIPLKKIVFEHFNPSFITTILFEQQGNATLLVWSMEFESVEMHDIVVKAHKADEGQKQNLEKMKKYLSKL